MANESIDLLYRISHGFCFKIINPTFAQVRSRGARSDKVPDDYASIGHLRYSRSFLPTIEYTDMVIYYTWRNYPSGPRNLTKILCTGKIIGTCQIAGRTVTYEEWCGYCDRHETRLVKSAAKYD